MFNHDPVYTRLYFEKFIPMNPLFPAAGFIEAGIIHSPSDIIPREELEQTRFYKEWVVPQGMVDSLAVNLEKGATRSSMLSIRTDASYGIADDEMRSRVAVLIPHVLRAVSIGRLFDQSRKNKEALTETLDHVEAAVVLVGADGAISFANDPAGKMLDEATLIRRHGHTLQATAAEANQILREVFAAAAKGDDSIGVRGVAVPLTRSSEARWFAHVLPLTSGRREEAGHANAAVAAVFIRESAPNAPLPLEAIAKLYKLTAGEVRVLEALLRVNGAKGMAESLGISAGTVKTHLHHLFRKTGTKRQADLVRLVAGL
jgi:DNA-binding CsgD family transcriptional regulator